MEIPYESPLFVDQVDASCPKGTMDADKEPSVYEDREDFVIRFMGTPDEEEDFSANAVIRLSSTDESEAERWGYGQVLLCVETRGKNTEAYVEWGTDTSGTLLSQRIPIVALLGMMAAYKGDE